MTMKLTLLHLFTCSPSYQSSYLSGFGSNIISSSHDYIFVLAARWMVDFPLMRRVEPTIRFVTYNIGSRCHKITVADLSV